MHVIYYGTLQLPLGTVRLVAENLLRVVVGMSLIYIPDGNNLIDTAPTLP